MADYSPFGKESRLRILKQHLNSAGPITAQTAWKFIYEELLWIDGSTGLAHLYESDKAQQGRPWYERTRVFTRLLCEQFGNISTEELRQRIDKLFRACLQKLLDQRGALDEDNDLLGALAAGDAGSYVPDSELVAEFATLLAGQAGINQAQAEELARSLVARARYYFTVERKRQNVLGEGFEDLLQLLMSEVSHVPENVIKVRVRANNLPGFQKASKRRRIEAPDIAIVRDNRTELLASVKWSLRHDRQKQLSDELDCYVDLLSQDSFPQYVLITNEYDPGRLVNTDGLLRRGGGIDRIYHINLELLMQILQDHERVRDLRPLIESGRLRSVESFLQELSANPV